jgi:hypothetical protein
MSTLSFSLNKYDSAMTNLLREVKTGLDKTDEILGQIQNVPVIHGGSTRQVSEPKIVDTELKTHKVEVIIHLDWYRKTDVDEFVMFVYGMWEQFASQAKQALFETLSLTTEAVGNSIDLQGRNFWDARIEMLEGLEMRFDEHGNHNTQFIVHPDTARKLEQNPPTPEQQKRWEDALIAKREEYYAQKRTRRLS